MPLPSTAGRTCFLAVFSKGSPEHSAAHAMHGGMEQLSRKRVQDSVHVHQERLQAKAGTESDRKPCGAPAAGLCVLLVHQLVIRRLPVTSRRAWHHGASQGSWHGAKSEWERGVNAGHEVRPELSLEKRSPGMPPFCASLMWGFGFDPQAKTHGASLDLIHQACLEGQELWTPVAWLGVGSEKFNYGAWTAELLSATVQAPPAAMLVNAPPSPAERIALQLQACSRTSNQSLRLQGHIFRPDRILPTLLARHFLPPTPIYASGYWGTAL